MKIVEVRVPEETKKKMEEIPEDWSNYLRHAIEERIVREKNMKVLEELKSAGSRCRERLRALHAAV